MQFLVKAIAVCAATAIFAASIRKAVPEMALGLQLFTVLLALLFALRLADPITVFLKNSADQFANTGIYVRPILKAAAIGVIANVGCSLCKDAGQTAFAAAIELLGTITILLSALPVLELFVHTIGELL